MPIFLQDEPMDARFADRKQYAESRMADKRNRPRAYGLDKKGYNRDIVNRQYFGDEANRNSRRSIGNLMDFSQRDFSGDDKMSTGELFDFTKALNTLNGLQRKRENINPMYLPDDELMEENLPNFAYGIGNDPFNTAPGVRPSELYADSNYDYGNSTGTRPYANMSRSNPYLKDLSGYSNMADINDDDYFMDIPGTNGVGQRFIGDQLDYLNDTVRFEDQGYQFQNPNPTSVTNFDEYFEGQSPFNDEVPLMEEGIGFYDGEPISREITPSNNARPDYQDLYEKFYDNPWGKEGFGMEEEFEPRGLPRGLPEMTPGLSPPEDQMAGTFGLPFNLLQDPTADGGFIDYFGRKISGDDPYDPERDGPFNPETEEQRKRRFMQNYG